MFDTTELVAQDGCNFIYQDGNCVSALGLQGSYTQTIFHFGDDEIEASVYTTGRTNQTRGTGVLYDRIQPYTNRFKDPKNQY